MKFRFPKRRAAIFYVVSALILGVLIFIGAIVSQMYMTTVTMVATVAPSPISDPYQSRFLPSTFYFPKGEEHPRDKKGRPMAILAQINFDEVPHLRGYPKTGILQFFTNAYDDLLGWDVGIFKAPEQRSGYHVRYFENVERNPEKLVSDFSFLPDATEFGTVDLPLHKECTLTFRKEVEFITPYDHRFFRLLGDDFFQRLGPLETKASNWFHHLPSKTLHKIGGWAFFAQDDPRFHLEEDWLLLFQMDSDPSDAEILWGDNGIGNFFIRPEDLEQLDFSNVAYEYSSH